MQPDQLVVPRVANIVSKKTGRTVDLYSRRADRLKLIVDRNGGGREATDDDQLDRD